eukprot:c14685_g3_i1 orf=395-1033(+)
MEFQLPPGGYLQTWVGRCFGSAEASTSVEREANDERRVSYHSHDVSSQNQEKLDMLMSGAGQEHARITDSKVLRRLAQNREAARKSRLRKKAYVQQLETSRVKLSQLEQELDRLRQPGFHVGSSSRGEQSHPGIAAFDMEYARWVEEQNQLLCKLRTGLAVHVADIELHALVDNGVTHYDDLFHLKSNAVKADVFHIVSGMWKTPAERCFMW